jgi:hypothetical protein
MLSACAVCMACRTDASVVVLAGDGAIVVDVAVDWNQVGTSSTLSFPSAAARASEASDAALP